MRRAWPVVCQHCKKTFYSERAGYRDVKFCSRQCHYASRKTTIISCVCAQCFKVFEVPLGRYNGAPTKFCSVACHNKSMTAREEGLTSSQQWKKNNIEKVRAHWKLNQAVRSGKIKKQPCEICKDTIVHAHHDDYTKPLDVRWLCPACHFYFTDHK